MYKLSEKELKFKQKEKERHALYYEKNKEKEKERRKKYSSEHKEQEKERHRKWYEKNKIKRKIRMKEYYNENKDKFAKNSEKLSARYNALIYDAGRRNVSMFLTFDEFCEAISKNCYYCDNLLRRKSRVGSGLDRINPNVGYQKDNVVSCCKICNWIKSNFFTVEETAAMVKVVLKMRKLIS